MPLPNPEIWGTPETWINAPYSGGDSSSIAESLKFSCPKCPDFETENNKTRLDSGITSGRIIANESLDLSICPCGQDENVSAYGKLAIFNENGDISLTPRVVERTSPVNWFMYDQLGDTSRRAESFKIYRDYSWSTSSGMKFDQWSPKAAQSSYNINRYISPYVYWYTRSLLLSIEVACINSVGNSGVNSTWYTLEDWKSNHNTQSICGVRCYVRAVNNYDANTNILSYINTGISQYRYSGKVGILDAIPDIKNNGELTDTTFYSFLSYSDRGRYLYLFKENASFGTSSGMAILPAWEMFDGQTINRCGNSSYGYVFYYDIPYSDDTYEKIMKMVACFGCYFTPTSKYEFHYDMTDDDLYLPVVGDDLIMHGEYTHGADNQNNELYNCDSIFEFEPSTGFKIYIGDNQVRKIYVGNKEVETAYLGNNEL